MMKVLFASAAIATAVALSPVAFAGTISVTTAINFTCSGEGVAGPGNTVASVGSGCTPFHSGGITYEGTNTNAWTNSTWFQKSQSGSSTYEVQSLSTNSANPGNPFVNVGNPGNGKLSSTASAISYHLNDGFNYTTGQTSAHISTLTSSANVAPSLGSLTNGNIKQLEISNTSAFFFDGFFFGETSANTTLSYMIFGYDGNTLVYCVDAAGNSCTGNLGNSWDHYTPSGSVSANQAYYTLLSLPGGDANTSVTRVYLDTQVPSGRIQDLDNFLVTQTKSVSEVPEPDSLILLGSGFGIVGFAMFLRRRRIASESTPA